MYYIDTIQRQFPFEMMGKDKKETYEFYRNKLLEHYMPGLNGQCMPDEKVIEAAGYVLHEMNTFHEDRNDEINPDFEIHIYAEWLKRNRQQFWSYRIDDIARMLGNGIYIWCKNHEKDNKNGVVISKTLLIAIEQLPLLHN